MSLIKSLLTNGYKLSEVKQLTLEDVNLMMDALDTEDQEEEAPEMTLDKAFPFLF